MTIMSYVCDTMFKPIQFFNGNCPHCKKYIVWTWFKVKGTGRTQEDVAEDYKNGIYSLGDSTDCPYCGNDLFKNDMRKIS